MIGGHFDFASEGKGIVDDWSGASLLPSLFHALKARPRQHTYVFVAFAGEERGLLGSERYVKGLGDQKSMIRAFINLECLGLSPVKVCASRSDRVLLSRLVEVARTTQSPLEGVNVDQVGEDDTRSFMAAKIPVLTIHSVTQATWPILHSPRDRLDAIHLNEYYDAYKLTAFYLAYLDVKAD